MRKVWLVAMVPAVLTAVVAVVLVTLLVVKLLWAWVVPDLFPGAVRQGLIAAEISWFTAFKVALVVGIAAGVARSSAHTER